MIVRILGEGQFDVADDKAAELERLDHPLEGALQRGDEAAFAVALDAVEAWVRQNGAVLDAATIVPSDLILPAQGSDLTEVRALLESESTES